MFLSYLFVQEYYDEIESRFLIARHAKSCGAVEKVQTQKSSGSRRDK